LLGRFVGVHKNGSAIDERFADAYTFENGKIRTASHIFSGLRYEKQRNAAIPRMVAAAAEALLL